MKRGWKHVIDSLQEKVRCIKGNISLSFKKQVTVLELYIDCEAFIILCNYPNCS